MDAWNIGNMWEILGIEPGADIKSIRAAYAEKVKEHHPEDDPEGFMRLRTAYKTAIQLASAKRDMPDAPRYDGQGARTEAAEPIPSEPETTAFDFSGVSESGSTISSVGMLNT